ncbi:hypothetical protein ZWY2020_050407 [Hordeum vulgare]|nr:hypothetical protein ZWY2020_050407 [Hordeum vulgare]
MLSQRDAEEPVAAVEEVTARPKIRKRCALSSSSGASGALRRLRLRRGVVSLHRRGSGGVSSPLPTSWKMSESSWNRACRADGMHSSVSARKLVNALWQMSEGGLLEEEESRTARDAAACRRGSAAATHRRCASSVEISKRSRTRSKVVLDDDHGRHWLSDKLSSAGTIGVQAGAQDWSSTCSADRTARLQDMYNSLTACKELVRVLGNVWGPGDLSPSTASLLSALRSELDMARAHARQLAGQQSSRRGEVELMKKRLEAEARAWKSKQREKVAATVRVVCDELDGERRSRRRAERVNAKLGDALAEAERELERERRSRERLEKVCDELVRGGEVEEEARREAQEAQAEVDREREMLRLADELREERVQMKLLEARLQFEEKNAVVEQLRGELEAFLETKKHGLLLELASPAAADEEHHQATHDVDHHGFFEAEGADGTARVDVGKRTDVDDDGDDSDGSDMHSIELNMDGKSKDCGGWSYSGTASKETMATTARKAASADSRETHYDPWAGGRQSLEESEGGRRWDDDDEGCSDVDEEDSERYQAIKNLREQMLAGHGLGSIFLSGAYEGDYTA